ncbi:unnamed protein product [Heligmosomoides polygyrus]|uniref:Endo/exonuclease/phosphatase domain-containing protein n=1 Tax=Heligmosomoides polygyrus TaxID=6339 RepID=A0A183FW23_HELPZ|nr:unnamed protein product [Heligmosomoides polygyrus]
MTICTYNARTLPLEAFIEDLMLQARKIKYDVIGLTETRRHHPLHALTTPEKNCSSECATAEDTHLAVNIDSYESLTSQIGRVAPWQL